MGSEGHVLYCMYMYVKSCRGELHWTLVCITGHFSVKGTTCCPGCGWGDVTEPVLKRGHFRD